VAITGRLSQEVWIFPVQDVMANTSSHEMDILLDTYYISLDIESASTKCFEDESGDYISYFLTSAVSATDLHLSGGDF